MTLRLPLSSALLLPLLLVSAIACSSDDGDDSGNSGGSGASGGQDGDNGGAGGSGGTTTGGTSGSGVGGATGGTDNVGGANNTGGTGGSGSGVCEPACVVAVAANCTNGPPDVDTCVTFCESVLDSDSVCKAPYQALLNCAEDGEYAYTCSDSGAAVPAACDTEVAAFVDCLDD